MLQQVCEFIHNYFIRTPYCGNYTIADGVISPSVGLKDGQRFWITGSDLNDGVYTYHESGICDDDDNEAVGLHDETFAGTICALSVPPAVIALSAEIKEWVETNSDALNSPYQSESFNGYSYSLKAGSGNGDAAFSWQNQFKSQLDRWRKVCL